MFVGEVFRKAIHLGSIVIPIAAALYDRLTMVLVLAGIAVLLVVTDFMKLRHDRFKQLFLSVFGRVLREKEQSGAMTASTIIIASSALTILVFRREIAVSVLVFVVLGDSAAALIGRHFGRIRLIHGRTLEGSLAMLVTCLFASAGLMYAASIMGWNLTSLSLIVGALVATVAELVELPLDDNLRIPILSGLAMELILPG
ncbi:hypothetical protein JW921_07735 [Candidatus Fermentibacterales bacterium]|nr:hypothetical protein [Candidatus Fermentibacterales bacterium]